MTNFDGMLDAVRVCSDGAQTKYLRRPAVKPGPCVLDLDVIDTDAEPQEHEIEDQGEDGGDA